MKNIMTVPSSLTRRGFLKRICFASAGLAAGASLLATSEDRKRGKPNIIFVLADDLGWAELGCYGNTFNETPRLDQLAREGVRFTDAYAAAPVCSPTRAAIATGQAPARLHITNHIPDRESFTPKNAKLLPAKALDHLPLRHVTIAERLKKAGYATAFMGKWHLAGRSGKEGLGDVRYYPENQGFDLNLGGCALGGPPSYFDSYRIHNLKSRRAGEYLPDRLADEAVAFMREHRDGPFFLALWNYTVHWPMEAPEALLKKYADRKGKPGLNDTRYGAMIEAMDAAVGRLLEALDEMRLSDDTLLVFTSDNGGFGGVADNRPLRAAKGHLYEGGIRVPLVVRWPGIVRAGAVCRTPVVSMDFYPTLLDAAGLKPDPDSPLDGENLMPLLAETGELRREEIFFHYPNYAWHKSNRLGGAVRSGDYKLILRYDDDSTELYNLADDIGEKRDLTAKMPRKASELKGKLKAWLRETKANMPVRK